VPDSQLPRHEKAWLSWGILGALVLAGALGWMSVLNAAMIAAAMMLVFGCCSVAVARRSIDVQVLLSMGSAFALGKALETTGVAGAITLDLMALTDNPWLVLVLVYVVTALLTAIITNIAAAVLMFPIVMTTAAAMGMDYLPFVVAIMMGASASFATPIGYQTNLMVYGLGGYRFVDYLRIGLPLNVAVGVVTLWIIPLVWPFVPVATA
jgi:di/tricarboxylate transporter